MPLLMSQKEYAAHRGVGPSAVSNWKKAGLLVFTPDAQGRPVVDVEKSDLLVNGKVDQTRGRPRNTDRVEGEAQAAAPVAQAPAAPRGMSPIETARLAEMEERTRARRIDTDVRLRKLVALEEYERRAGDLGRMIREGVHATLRQVAERVAAETDPRQVMAVLGEAFDQVFTRVANEVEAEATLEREVDATLTVALGDEEEDAEL